MVPSENQPRIWRNGYKLGHGNWKIGIEIATWNTLNHFRIGACQNLSDVLETYGIHIAALQEIRWSGNGQLKVGKYIIYFSGMEERHIFGSGFTVHETLEPYIKEFNPVSERIAVLRVDTKPLNIVLVCTHAPTDTRDEDIKDAFYEELAHTYDNIPGNVIKLVIGDLNAKCGREIQFNPTLGNESLHEKSNGNGLRLIFFAAAKNMTISSTTFPHKAIHKATWKSPDGITTNQIDHILIQKRFRSCIKDIRSYRGADCDTDHFLVVAKFEIKLQSRKQLEKRNSRKINLEMLKDEEIQQKYSKSIGEYIKGIELNDIDEDWDKVSKAIKQIAVENIGMIRNEKKKWYNENCQKAIRKRQTAHENYITEDSADTKRVYFLERKMCKRVLQREKRKYLS
ncbi:PREDICTED: craniofacial development protein 2-like [Diuraphis noxia]|uniref:craniofacial development protein 2-like n=1 Tax=Diuraphis noxia TaxID=143948 RepID=UPI0007635EB3|nr:PREDICTED: craniofacial development protein 2-like [Diuraphis noxia]